MSLIAVVNVLWALLFTFLGAIFGSFLLIKAAAIVPKILNENTPNINEGKEIVRGNVAVAEYYGRVTSAVILGISIIIATSVLGGLLSGLHG